MKILFIAPLIYSNNPTRPYNVKYIPGVASLSAYLKKFGYPVALLQYFYPPDKEKLLSEISNQAPDIIGFSFTTHMFHYVKDWSRWIKESLDIPIICGGIHATLEPEDTIAQEGIDMVCIGEGEKPLLELCRKYEKRDDIRNILNIWVKKDNKIYKNPLRPLIEDLDSLPFPDHGIFKPPVGNERGYLTIRVIISRGCLYNCSYCCNPRLRSIYQGKFKKFVRYRSVENTIQYLKKLITEYSSAEYIEFTDDTLNFYKSWFAKFAIKYKEEIGLPYQCNSRVDYIDKRIARLLRYSGCRRILLGVESGNDYIRKKIYNKNIERKQIIKAFKLCQNEGIHTQALNMIGAPFEDMKAILDTIKLNAAAKVSNGVGSGDWPSIFYPYPGTKLYKICKENKFITNRQLDCFAQDTVLSQPTITSEQIIFVKYSFMYFVKLYIFINRLPLKFKKFFNKLIDMLFLYERLPYTFMTFILQELDNIIFRLFIIEKNIRLKCPGIRRLINIIKKR